MTRSPSRRRFLKQTAAMAAGGFVALEPASSLAQQPTPAVSLDDLARLIGNHAQLVRPGSSEHSKIKYYNARFDCVRTTTYVRPVDADGVRLALDWAAANGQTLAVRGGGHSFEGKSSHPELVLDLSQLKRHRLDDDGMLQAEPGVRLGEVYTTLTAAGRVIPGGTCPTVGLIGHVLGGGIGDFLPMFGFAAQSLVSVTLVTFGGTILRVDDERIEMLGGRPLPQPQPAARDLMRALRGGGQGMFGVVMSVRLRTHDVRRATFASFKLGGADSVSAARAKALILAWQTWHQNLPTAQQALASAKLNLSQSGGRYGVDISGLIVAPASGPATTRDIRRTLDPLFAMSDFSSKQFKDAITLDAAIASFLDTDETTLNSKREMMYGASSMFERALPERAVDRLVRGLGGNFASLYTAGGASLRGPATSLHPAAIIVEWSKYGMRRDGTAHRRLKALKAEVATVAGMPDRSFPNYPADTGGGPYFADPQQIEALHRLFDPAGISTSSLLGTPARHKAGCG